MVQASTGFAAGVACKVAGISYRQLVHWDETGLVRPTVRPARGSGSRRVYAFGDLLELRVVGRLLRSGLTLPTVRKAARFLRQHRGDLSHPLARMTLIADGRRVLLRTEEGGLLDVTSGGQVVIAVAVGAIAAELRQTVAALQAPREIVVVVRGVQHRVVLTPDLDAGGFTVQVPALAGVITEADSVAEARRNVRDAIALWLDARDGQGARRRAAG